MKCVCVDDERIFLKQIAEYIKLYQRKNAVLIDLTCCQSPESLLDDAEWNLYDLYILDIDLKHEIDGLELAKKIRGSVDNAKIVFLTSCDQYALESYECHAEDYIMKAKLDKLGRILDQVKREEEKNQYLIVAGRTSIVKIKISDIRYIYKDGKDSVIVCGENQYEAMRRPLYQIYEEIQKPEMLKIGNNYIINMLHVVSMMEQDIYFDLGKPIHIGRNQKKMVSKTICDFWDLQKQKKPIAGRVI